MSSYILGDSNRRIQWHNVGNRVYTSLQLNVGPNGIARLTCEFAQENTMSQRNEACASILTVKKNYNRFTRQLYGWIWRPCASPAPGLAHPTPSGQQTNSKQDHTVHMCWFWHVLSSGIFWKVSTMPSLLAYWYVNLEIRLAHTNIFPN